MHRQSLGSPSPKLDCHGGAKEEAVTGEEPKRRDPVSSSFYDEDDDNARKSRRASSPPPRTEKLIHLLPILILFCFLVLYLCSHTPSASDMASFTGFKRSPKLFDSAAEMNDIRQYISVKRGDILPIRSIRNLHEIGKRLPKSRPHRKFADF
ncbi:Cysteine-rich venom protein like [Senna tora]|uniref:Cysteine-rich venom protein like n=1 Tax=Senna tora TaxID=362788 RepID=A0A834TXS5_9FABA|nr:Cysteine-rich venom protein like [Senna tora]